jgi:hypothetical protein
MFPGFHDSLLVGYAVDLQREEIQLSLQPHHGAAQGPFQLVFRGVAAHSFPHPHLPAIMAAVIAGSAAALIARHWPEVVVGFAANGWPGPWASTLESAQQFCASRKLQGFEVESSYGLFGWVLALSAEVVDGL